MGEEEPCSRLGSLAVGCIAQAAACEILHSGLTSQGQVDVLTHINARTLCESLSCGT